MLNPYSRLGGVATPAPICKEGLSHMSQYIEVCVGIDVSKEKWDVAVSGQKGSHTFAADRDGEKRLLQLLRPLNVKIVCIEATGCYQRGLVKLLQEHDYAVAIVNPRLPRDFAKSMNRLAKTDAIDARILSMYAERYDLQPTPPTSKSIEKIEALSVRRRQLVGMRTQESNRCESTFDAEMKASLQMHLAYLQEEIKRIERQIEKLVDSEPDLQVNAKLIASTPGVGMLTACRLVIELRELGLLNRKEIARLVGLAPINRDSGKMRGIRKIGGGRTHIRNALYMPTLVAIKHNPKIKECYDRLIAKGKKPMVAIIACMRKLLTILNVMIRDQTAWGENLNAA